MECFIIQFSNSIVLVQPKLSEGEVLFYVNIDGVENCFCSSDNGDLKAINNSEVFDSVLCRAIADRIEDYLL